MPNKPDRVAEAGAWVLENGHRALLALTGGRFPRTVMGMLTVELHTVGRKSGQKRTVPLIYLRDGDNIVVVASQGGMKNNPAWYLNVTADPAVTIEVDGKKLALTARTADADEKAALWPRLVDLYADFDNYEAWTERDIPVVICEPSGS